VACHLSLLDGVMVGREAYHNPWSMAGWDTDFLGADKPAAAGRDAVEAAMVAYMTAEGARAGTPWPHIARHMLGLWNGTPGARRWRQVWSDHRLRGQVPADVASQAAAARLASAV
jgi:tRNA-dihydrouridine synthase A